MFSGYLNFINLIVILLSFFVVKKLFDFIRYLKPFLKLPKDPECSFLFGDLLTLKSAFLNKKLTSIYLTKYLIENAAYHQIKSGVHVFWLGWWPFVFINDHKSVEALISKSHITKPYLYGFIGLKEGLVTSKGEKWKMRRKMIEPFFVSKQQKRFAVTMDEVFDSLINKDDFCEEGKYSTLADQIHLSTFDIIFKVTADLPIGAEREEKLHMMDAIEFMEMIMIERACNPLYWIDRIFFLTKLGKKVTSMTSRGYKFFESVVNRNLDENSNKIESSTLSSLNLVNMLAGSSRGKIDSEGISEELLTTAAAGHETTATALNLILFILGNRPEIQEKLYQEISSVFDNNDSVNDIEKVNKCNYLDKCIKESMRLYPPIPLIARELDEPMEINSYYLPKGTTVGVNIFSIQRDPRIYPNPTQYDPERFDLSNLPNIPKGAYIPFGVAPRNCIGYRFALIEMKIFLIHLIRRYEIFSAKKLEDVSFRTEFTLKPSCPLEIMLRKRNLMLAYADDNLKFPETTTSTIPLYLNKWSAISPKDGLKLIFETILVQANTIDRASFPFNQEFCPNERVAFDTFRRDNY
ncbi:cytochrome P450 4V2-like [Panonychus citri]|uniref:cytochrome P450 4V2-like n=1 Tax=Panonychus citri TaxID=50023 RepID=UPI0023074D8F|nr:cytochrome P450 4V2-like isoform X1 [Panonychus citri]XP_053205064.1 cytochrome P450 4V2-like [Panonychus citri]